MEAGSIMIKQVYKVKEQDKVSLVLEKFIENRIGGVPVVNDRNEVVGYISDGDILRWIGNQDPVWYNSLFYSMVWTGQGDMGDKYRDLINRNVMDIATKKVIAVDVDTPLSEVASILGKKQIKKVPVLKKGVLAGIISRGDMIRNIYMFYKNS